MTKSILFIDGENFLHKVEEVLREAKIAVDLVALACDKRLDSAILCSSDSDLQPAVTELKQRNIEIVYVGFETNPNKGLSYTTNRTILLRNPEVIEALQL